MAPPPPATASAADDAHGHVGHVALNRIPHGAPVHRRLDNPTLTATMPPMVVPMSLYAENRQKLCARLKKKLASTTFKRAIVLMEGGKEEYRYESDAEKIFRQESSFAYLFGVKEPGFYGTIDVESGKTTLYTPRLPVEYAVWMGKIQPPSHFKALYEVDEVMFVDELAKHLVGGKEGEAGDEVARPDLLLLNQGLNTDSGNMAKPAFVEGVTPSPPTAKEGGKKGGSVECDYEMLYPELVECRVFKSEAELQVMQYVNDISSDAHLAVMGQVKVGMTEYQLESLFLHHGYFFGGCRHVAYTSICGCGPNAATLHYGHAGAPNDRLIREGDMLLLDMGAEYKCYTSDITCSFPATGRFSADQRMIFECVQAMQFAVLDALKPGVAWVDMHALAYRVGLEKLVEGGLLKGGVEEMMKENLMSFFMPHGLGHFMGLDVHDVGGFPPSLGLKRDERKGFKNLRTGRRMEVGMVITVEPGVYFIDLLMDELVGDERVNKFVNVEMLESRFRGFGGVRLEDDVVIVEGGVRNMTRAPRTVEDVEAVMAGKITTKEELFKK
ncbi:peptidase d [Nannochloropsis oceanica]